MTESFDDLLRPEASAERPRVRRSPLLPFAALLFATLGIAALAAAVLVPELGGPPQTATPAATSSPAPTMPAADVRAVPSPAPTSTDAGATADARTTVRPISQLADAGWVTRIATLGDIPPRALAAYAGAALTMQTADPGCGLGWNTLAAIGFVESEHGTIHGGRIRADGMAVPLITGIALDGEQTERIPDTDDGRLDGDAAWDRAVGPMQFIPSTWDEWAQDGDGDGEADVSQIDDAALAAARYLCATGGDLTDGAGWIAAVHAYNPSIDYNNRVADAADRYATLG